MIPPMHEFPWTVTAHDARGAELLFPGQGEKAIIGVWRDGCWSFAFLHQDGQVTTHQGRPGAGPHRVFREVADKAAYELEELLNISCATDLAASVAQMTQGDSDERTDAVQLLHAGSDEGALAQGAQGPTPEGDILQ